jgi:endonuclease/exonuclease/phosphatase family metal-dependent hydrolase
MRIIRSGWLIAIIGCMLIGTNASAAEPVTINVMTFNIRYATAPDGANAWDKRKDLVRDAIRQFGPDLLGTQEVLAVQADFLASELPEFQLIGVGRDDGKRAGEFSAVLFRRDRFEIFDSGTFWLSETPEKPGSKSWDSSLPRVATWVRLRDRANDGRQICYLNTHWDHRGNRARVESARIIHRWIAEHAAGAISVLTGDLNVTDEHEGYRTLVANDAEPQLHDVYRQAHPQAAAEEATFHNFLGGRRGRRIDFIFASPECRAVEAAIVYANRDGQYPSDHYPVTATLEIVPAK